MCLEHAGLIPSEKVPQKYTYDFVVLGESLIPLPQERVKEISDAYFAKEFTKHPPNEKNLLKGKIVCGDCGKGMRLSPRTTKSYVYFCGTFSDGINPACSNVSLSTSGSCVFSTMTHSLGSVAWSGILLYFSITTFPCNRSK